MYAPVNEEQSYRGRFWSAFAASFLCTGVVFPLVGFWAVAWAFAGGAGPSPLWGLLVLAFGVVLLGWLRYTHPESVSVVGAFSGAVSAAVILACSVSVLMYRSANAKSEFQRVIYRYRDPPSSLRVLDGSNHVLWRLRSNGAPESLSLPEPTEVHYGVVPPGFVQEVPSSGPPRPFVVGEAIEIQVEAQRYSHTAKGYARGPDRVQQLQTGVRSR
jgi:hypothetical protein